MPEKPMTVAAYAAGASLAAITLVYVFGPTFFLDDDTSKSSRKKGVVGLSNPSNLCFVNSILQVLAGLGDLRIYLIRELHRRQGNDWGKTLDNVKDQTEDGKPPVDPKKLEGLRKGLLTQALKTILDQLNERPIYRKTVSAHQFIAHLENAFRTRLSTQQQDAQEFFQIVAERLCDEYHARVKADRLFRKHRSADAATALASPEASNIASSEKQAIAKDESAETNDDDDTKGSNAFPLEGVTESEIECLTCHFKPKPNRTSFVNLTLNVPQQSSTSLDICIDGMFKSEQIADFKCDRCRLEHAIHYKRQKLDRTETISADDKALLESEIRKIEEALRIDPEKPPVDAHLPDAKFAPKSRIEKSVRISVFPKILAIHLSRSIFDPGSVSVKNLARVSFPELLSIGGILDRRKYKLLGVVAHQGGHHSGHYETFRRQTVYLPYSTPHNLNNKGGTLPQTEQRNNSETTPTPSATIPTTDLTKSQSPGSKSTNSSESSSPTESPGRPSNTSRGGSSTRPGTGISAVSPINRKSTSAESLQRFRKRDSKANDRWWRISDDKIRESRTSDVLSMQKEVYLLFYELVDEAGSS